LDYSTYIPGNVTLKTPVYLSYICKNVFFSKIENRKTKQVLSGRQALVGGERI
jgi:hypothetical protein